MTRELEKYRDVAWVTHPENKKGVLKLLIENGEQELELEVDEYRERLERLELRRLLSREESADLVAAQAQSDVDKDADEGGYSIDDGEVA